MNGPHVRPSLVDLFSALWFIKNAFNIWNSVRRLDCMTCMNASPSEGMHVSNPSDLPWLYLVFTCAV